MTRLDPDYWARIKFLGPEEGGMKNLPESHLAAPVKIEGVSNWTLLVEFLAEPTAGEDVPALVDFLADEAPRELLKPNTRFQLLQGNSVVAEGVVTSGEPAA